MNRFVTTLSVISILICASNCVDFCNVLSIDNVFNIGHLTYLVRCGEVWTYDPRMQKNRGGFIRDYAFFAYARNWFGQRLFEKYNLKEWDDKHLKDFAAFSFQEVYCKDWRIDIKRNCENRTNLWNGLTIMADDRKMHGFYYRNDMEWEKDEKGWYNPVDPRLPEVLNYRTESHPFLPDPKIVAAQFGELTGKWIIRCGVFDRHKFRLYLGLYSSLIIVLVLIIKCFEKGFIKEKEGDEEKKEVLQCITHTNLKPFMTDERITPNKSGLHYKWGPAFCFTGNMIGMFYDERKKQPYVVGRILYSGRIYDDQIYKMEVSGESAEVKVEMVVSCCLFKSQLN